MALKMHPSLAVHVGDWLKSEIIEPACVSVTDLAAHFGVRPDAILRACYGVLIDPTTALL